MVRTKKVSVMFAGSDLNTTGEGDATVTLPETTESGGRRRLPTRVRLQCDSCGEVRGSEPPPKILVQFGTDKLGNPRYYEFSRTRMGKTTTYKPSNTMKMVNIRDGRIDEKGNAVFAANPQREEGLDDDQLSFVLGACLTERKQSVGLNYTRVKDSPLPDADSAAGSGQAADQPGTSASGLPLATTGEDGPVAASTPVKGVRFSAATIGDDQDDGDTINLTLVSSFTQSAH